MRRTTQSLYGLVSVYQLNKVQQILMVCCLWWHWVLDWMSSNCLSTLEYITLAAWRHYKTSSSTSTNVSLAHPRRMATSQPYLFISILIHSLITLLIDRTMNEYNDLLWTLFSNILFYGIKILLYRYVLKFITWKTRRDKWPCKTTVWSFRYIKKWCSKYNMLSMDLSH